MANHGYVYTKKHLTQQNVKELLDRVNQDYLFGLMHIEETIDSGRPFWVLTFDDVDGERQCWITSPTHFEMRHGCGGNFLWWVDSLIQDEIAREFKGKVSDDGVGESSNGKTWDTPLNFQDYINKVIGGRGHVDFVTRFIVSKTLMLGVSKKYMKALKKSK